MRGAVQLPAHPDGYTVSPPKPAARSSVYNSVRKPTSNRGAHTHGIESDEADERKKEDGTIPHNQPPKMFSTPSDT